MAEPELVAITTTMLAAMAYLMSRPTNVVKNGVTIKPPPMPSTEPIAPAKSPIPSMINKDVSACVNKFPHFYAYFITIQNKILKFVAIIGIDARKKIHILRY